MENYKTTIKNIRNKMSVTSLDFLKQILKTPTKEYIIINIHVNCLKLIAKTKIKINKIKKCY